MFFRILENHSHLVIRTSGTRLSQIERHSGSKRSRRQNDVLCFLACDAGASVLIFAESSLRKSEQSDAILSFIRTWNDRTGARPTELVFDCKLITFANFARLDELGIRFLTVRSRSARMLFRLAALLAAQWPRVTLSSIGRVHSTPRMISSLVRLR